MSKSGYLLFFISLLSTTFCLGQKAKLVDGKLSGILPVDPQGHVCYQNNFRIEGLSKQELFKRANKWFKSTYASPKGELICSADSTGEISGRGSFTILETKLGISRSYVVRYTLTFTARTDSYGLTISKFSLDGPHAPIPIERIPHAGKSFRFRLYEQLDERADVLVASLQQALATKTDF